MPPPRLPAETLGLAAIVLQLLPNFPARRGPDEIGCDDGIPAPSWGRRRIFCQCNVRPGADRTIVAPQLCAVGGTGLLENVDVEALAIIEWRQHANMGAGPVADSRVPRLAQRDAADRRKP